MRSINIVCALLVAGTALAAGRPAAAQSWPARPIRMVSPFVAGTTHDLVARTLLDPVGQQLGQSIVIDNQPGGDGTAGPDAVVHAAPDGYTLLLGSSSLSGAILTHKTLPYDVLRDLEPVAMFGGQPSVLVVTPNKGYKTVADLVAAAKARPGEIKFASVGIGSASYVAAETFRLAAGIDVQHVPYGGPVQALDDLSAGRIDFYFLPIPPSVPLIAQGKIVALAVSMPNHSLQLPGVPTLAQAGYPIPEFLIWDGILAPAKTPPDIVTKLNDAVAKSLGLPPIRDKLQRSGVEPSAMSVGEFGKFFNDDAAAMIKLRNDAHIEPSK